MRASNYMLVNYCTKSNVSSLITLSDTHYHHQEMYYPDGQSPPAQILSEWLQLLSATFENNSKDDTPCIAIHCVAGLGRFDF